ANYEFVDVKEYSLPLLDEPNQPSQGKYTKDYTKRWAAKIDSLDAFVFVTPEYNHGAPAALKNALDYLYKEWNNKAAGFVSYGGQLGARSVEALRLTLVELQMASIRQQVLLSLRADWENFTVFKPGAYHEAEVKALIDQLLLWGEALKGVREKL